MNLCRFTKTHDVSPEANSSKRQSFLEKSDNRQVRLKSNELKIIQLGLGSLSKEEMGNSKQKSKSGKSPHIFPFITIPKSMKRQQRKTHDSVINSSLECHKMRSQISLQQKMRSILLKTKEQPILQKPECQKSYKLLKPEKLFSVKINQNNLSMCMGEKEAKKIQKIKQNFEKMPQKELKVIKANVESWLVNREVLFPKLKRQKVKTHHIKIL